MADLEFFSSGVLFPIVILTMVIERVSITVAEEGSAEAARKAANTVWRSLRWLVPKNMRSNRPKPVLKSLLQPVVKPAVIAAKSQAWF